MVDGRRERRKYEAGYHCRTPPGMMNSVNSVLRRLRPELKMGGRRKRNRGEERNYGDDDKIARNGDGVENGLYERRW